MFRPASRTIHAMMKACKVCKDVHLWFTPDIKAKGCILKSNLVIDTLTPISPYCEKNPEMHTKVLLLEHYDHDKYNYPL